MKKRALIVLVGLAGLGIPAAVIPDDELADILRRGAGADAEDAAIGEGPVEGVDRIGEAALLADLLEQAR